jgi:hypothetical protein
MMWRRRWSLRVQIVLDLLRGSSSSVIGHQLPAFVTRLTSHARPHTSHAKRHTSPFLNELQPAGRMQQMWRRVPRPARAGRTWQRIIPGGWQRIMPGGWQRIMPGAGAVRRQRETRSLHSATLRIHIHIYTHTCTHTLYMSVHAWGANSNTSGSTFEWSKASCCARSLPPSSCFAAAAQHQRAAGSEPYTPKP